jgi:hypothetical protein
MSVSTIENQTTKTQVRPKSYDAGSHRTVDVVRSLVANFVQNRFHSIRASLHHIPLLLVLPKPAQVFGK